MSNSNFNPYRQWLGIPEDQLPPTHYRLLGLENFEADVNVIANAADRTMLFVRTFQTGQHSAASQQLLNKLAAARVCLLNAKSKREYDATLRRTLKIKLSEPAVSTPPPVTMPPPPVSVETPVVVQPPVPIVPISPPVLMESLDLYPIPQITPSTQETRRETKQKQQSPLFYTALLGAVCLLAVFGYMMMGSGNGAEARKHYIVAQGHFDKGEYEKARESVRRAIDLHDLPEYRKFFKEIAKVEEKKVNEDVKVIKEVEAEDEVEEVDFDMNIKKVDIFNDKHSPKNELAVARGLHWIAEHQYANGAWNYDHRFAPKCQSKCRNQGVGYTKAINAATSMGILPFLGNGITHKEGTKQYRQTVHRGLQFLCSRMQPDGSFRYDDMDTGTMYSHGLAAICLTEAYGMTKDNTLRQPAQKSIDFIVFAQDPSGGGWNHQPKEAGDTHITAWQMMALKSGFMAYLKVPPEPAQRAIRFLDHVQADGGGKYKLQPEATEAEPNATAAALLCQMYYGWDRNNPALQIGVQYLSDVGPSPDYYVYNYHATQVMYHLMHHFEGAEWRQWNQKMRDQLVRTQVSDKNSHEFGSWYTPTDKEGIFDSGGGRLAQTSLAVQTLEVYYRYSPIYKKQSLEGGMPLD